MLAPGFEALCGFTNDNTCWLTKDELCAAYVFVVGFQAAAMELVMGYPDEDRDESLALPEAIDLWRRTVKHVQSVGAQNTWPFQGLGRALWFRKTYDRSLEQLIRTEASSACSDLQDQVYGLLGLAKDVTDT